MARRFHIATIIGARPQFLKAAPLSPELRRFARETVIHTGQHYDWRMSGQFFTELRIPKPTYNLHVGSGSHAEQTAAMMTGIEHILQKIRPDLVLLLGDTNSTLAGALSATKLNIPIAHVEAGMRSFDRSMPEEINRVLADHVSTLLFCPSKTAVKNLHKEGVKKNVFQVGDNMLDILFQNLRRAKRSPILGNLGIVPGHFLLITIHRASNTDTPERLRSIFSALSGIDEKMVFPVHPRTRVALKKNGLDRLLQKQPNILLIDPVGYTDMIALMRGSRMVLTDSGGVQKEAFSLKKPCITLRTTTEWTETVSAGWNKLVGWDAAKIRNAVRNWNPASSHQYHYGKGAASHKIAKIIFRFLASQKNHPQRAQRKTKLRTL